jgi:hypothetical protein
VTGARTKGGIGVLGARSLALHFNRPGLDVRLLCDNLLRSTVPIISPYVAVASQNLRRSNTLPPRQSAVCRIAPFLSVAPNDPASRVPLCDVATLETRVTFSLIRFDQGQTLASPMAN